MRAPIAAILLLASCAGAERAQSPTAIHLAGTSWTLVEDSHVGPHAATMQFEAARASGHTSCNRWFAPVTQDGEELRFDEIGVTRMACQTPVQEAAERAFLAALRDTRYAHYDQDALVLLDSEQRIIATFARSP